MMFSYESRPAFKRSDIDRNIRLFYGFAASRNVLLVVPILVPHLMGSVSLSFHQVILSEAAFAATVVLFEVPSGWLADHWQRRHVLAIGGIFSLCGGLFLWGADQFYWVVIAQVLLGIGISAQSGADVALLYDSLAVHRRQGQFLTYESRRLGIGLTVLAVASLFSGWVYAINPDIVFAVSALAFGGTVVIAFLMVEPPRNKPSSRVTNPFALFRVLKATILNNPTVLWVLVFAMGLFSATKASVWLQQDYLQDLHLDIVWFGPVAAASFLVGAIGSQCGPRLTRYIPAEQVLVYLALSVAAAYFIAGTWIGVPMIGLLFAGSAGWGLGGPLVTQLIQDTVTSDRRATIQSTLSLGFQLAFIPLADVIGRVADWKQASAGYIILAVFIIMIAVPAGLRLRRQFQYEQ